MKFSIFLFIFTNVYSRVVYTNSIYIEVRIQYYSDYFAFAMCITFYLNFDFYWNRCIRKAVSFLSWWIEVSSWNSLLENRFNEKSSTYNLYQYMFKMTFSLLRNCRLCRCCMNMLYITFIQNIEIYVTFYCLLKGNSKDSASLFNQLHYQYEHLIQLNIAHVYIYIPYTNICELWTMNSEYFSFFFFCQSIFF